MLGYGQQVGGTHSIGMHSCLFESISFIFDNFSTLDIDSIPYTAYIFLFDVTLHDCHSKATYIFDINIFIGSLVFLRFVSKKLLTTLKLVSSISLTTGILYFKT